VAGLRRFYDKDDLPALFSRTLALDKGIPAGSTLDWIFTGEQGGFTVELTATDVSVRQRYYDSIALSSQNPPKANYPEATRAEARVSFRGVPRLITVVLDHQLALTVLLNGKQVAKQTCLMEVRRHQIAWTPAVGAKQGGLTGRVIKPSAIDVTITVKTDKKYQTIYGFGGSISFPAYAQLSEEGKRRWWALLLAYNLLIHREYPNGQNLQPDLSNFDRLEDASPHYYGDNFPNGEISNFQYLKRIRQLGGKSIFEFWQLPPWALREVASEGGKVSEVPILGEYLRAVLGYCRISKEASGFAPDIVGIQNEIGQSPATWHEMILRLREALDQEGFQSVKIQMPDRSYLHEGIRAARSIAASPAAWKAIDYAATHVYDFQDFFENPDGYDERARQFRESIGDKPFLATEFTVNRAQYQSRSYRIAFAMAQLYHKSMAIMNAQSLLYCWTLLDVEQPSFGASRSLFVPDRENGYVPKPSSFELRTYGAFSRRLREGMMRLEAVSTDPELLVTAYEGSAGARTAILINRSTAPRRILIDWPGNPFTVLEVAGPYAGNAIARPFPDSLVVQPGEIVTLSNVPLLEGSAVQ
jgi:O-glycosyl hydrolase